MTANTSRITGLAQEVGERLKSQNFRLVTAESCTGGGVAYAITAIAGSSDWFDRGFIVYSNQAKTKMLQVRAESLANHGAVSEEVAREMAAGALHDSDADISLAVTGIAGPAGGTDDKPVGTVCFAWLHKNGHCSSRQYHLQGDRQAVREQSIVLALEGILAMLESGK